MKIWQKHLQFGLGIIPLVLAASPGLAQVPVDDAGEVIGEWQDQPTAESAGDEGIPLLGREELQDLVGPVALYPDDLLAIVLPAATYPLQVVQAARFLENLKSDPSLEPDPKWDDSVVALLNYPEVIELLNEDLDWTWQLGEAVVAQQGDVVSAVEAFRNSAYAAGNLRSDDRQQVIRDEGVIEISPVSDDIIYVPYYEPEQVIVHQSQPVYYYYDRPFPVYYYPYPSYHAFNRGYFWGVTTAFNIGWASNRLHVYHHSYHGHPYYGHHYRNRWRYRQPSISTHNRVYVHNSRTISRSRHSRGDYWRPSRNTRLRHTNPRITRNVRVNNHNDVRNNRNAVQTNIRRTAPVRESRENLRRDRSQVREHRTPVRVPATTHRQAVDRPANTQARNDSHRSARRETRSEPRRETRSESRHEPRRESRNESRSESTRSRPSAQRQARNDGEPKRRRR